jgi:predicted nucleic acid-binding protein
MEMTGVSELFIDTNTLVYSTNILSPWHQIANAVVQRFRGLGTELIVSPQIIREYLAVNTRLSVTSKEPPLSSILDNVQSFRASFRLVEETGLVLDALADILRTIPVAGKQVYDANIVATMQVYGISHLLTHNTADFARFSRFITIVPLENSP